MVIDPAEGVGAGDGVGEDCTEAEPPPQPDNPTTIAIVKTVPVSYRSSETSVDFF